MNKHNTQIEFAKGSTANLPAKLKFATNHTIHLSLIRSTESPIFFFSSFSPRTNSTVFTIAPTNLHVTIRFIVIPSSRVTRSELFFLQRQKPRSVLFRIQHHHNYTQTLRRSFKKRAQWSSERKI